MGGSSSRNNSSHRPTRDNLLITRIVIVGDSGIGKTSLLTRFSRDIFRPSTEVYFTFELDGAKARFHLDGRDIKALVWDTNGLYEYRCMLDSAVRVCSGIIIVYDVTNQESFNNLTQWLERIEDVRGEKVLDKLIIGNKCDLTTQRVVEYTTAKEFADKHGIPLVEASAKTAINVNQAFIRLFAAITNRISEQSLEDDCVPGAVS